MHLTVFLCMKIQWFMILWDSDEHLIKYCFIITVTIIWSLQETLKCSHCLMYQIISLTPHPWLLWFGSVFLRISSVFLTSPWCYWTFASTCRILPPPQYIWSCPQNHWNIQRIKSNLNLLQVRLKVAYLLEGIDSSNFPSIQMYLGSSSISSSVTHV